MNAAELGRVAVFADRAEKAALTATLLLRQQRHTEAQQYTEEAARAAADARIRLQADGVTLPGQSMTPEPVPFHLMDTPDVRELLTALEQLRPLAERIDAIRGRVLHDPIGGASGLDLAEDIGQIVARLTLEVHGPAASVTGGRE